MTFHDFLTGDVLTASDLELYVMKQSGKPLCCASKTANQSVNNATNTALTYDTEQFDTDSIHSTVSNTSRFTAPITGKYRFSVQLEWAHNANGVREVYVRLSTGGTLYRGNRIQGFSVVANEFQTTSGVIPVTMTAGDYAEIVVVQTTGGALNCATSEVDFVFESA